MFKIRYTIPAFESGMRVLFLLTVTVMFACYLAAADLAAEIAKRDKAVAEADSKLAKVITNELKKAKDSEKPELYKLLLKYDPENVEAKKFVEATVVGQQGADLLSPMKTITSAQATAIGKIYKNEKITEADWKTFPGEVIEVPITGVKGFPTKIKYTPGEVLMILPNPASEWTEGQPGDPMSTFRGTVKGQMGQEYGYMGLTWIVYDGTKTVQMKVRDQYLVNTPTGGELRLGNIHAETGKGTMSVKVVKVSDK